jgi:hypothetical protein
MKMMNYLFDVENEALFIHLRMNISGEKQIVYEAKKLVFGHYSYQFDHYPPGNMV